MKRTNTCGELKKSDSGKRVILNGWVHRKRDHGGISFINLRDRYGITQTVVDPAVFPGGQVPADLASATADLRNEFCLAVEGTVRARPDSMVNPDMPTGDIEVLLDKIVILSRCETLPFQIDEKSDAREELRLKYRYLDLRSGAMQRRIKLRNDVTFAVREYMIAKGFYEVETPTFIRSTPEGARDYVVPSRLYPGKFYALPQSPQLFKQILMVSGFDKYFQIARCYRDEDSRGDRQPEFTQIDIEMSFVGREDVLSLIEGLMAHAFKKGIGLDIPTPFKRLSYDDAMDLYGTDKPDLRFDMLLKDFSPWVAASEFQAFKDALSGGGGAVKALVVPGKMGDRAREFSRKQIEDLEARAKIYRARGLAWMRVAANGTLEGGVAKFFASQAADITHGLGADPGDLILIVADSARATANTALGAVRSKLGRDLGLCDPNKFEFAWIIDFPLFEYNEDQQRWQASHHMFSFPQEKYHATLESDPGSVKGDLYDLVLNGFELASGSIRIHDPELQKRIFKVVGFDPAEAESKFGFLIEAFKYGPPPHGGIAPGLDRLVMLMAGETSIKEVIAFPKNSFAVSPLDDSPNTVSPEQLKELHLIIDAQKSDEKTS
ncbi:MAG: aspartate--tRNA ligase [Treponema sp.]|nr:aspartate--tRNA ligase [Treponema sp.]